MLGARGSRGPGFDVEDSPKNVKLLVEVDRAGMALSDPWRARLRRGRQKNRLTGPKRRIALPDSCKLIRRGGGSGSLEG